MGKILIGVATAALWFALSHVANAEQICRQDCVDGTCVSRCVERSDPGVTVRDHDEDYRDRDRRPGVDIRVPGVGVEIGR
jgi:hypothetical protein